jgi:large subunit ribosomal protein L19
MGMRRRGVDTSFTLRNVIGKLGVESAFKIYSPMIKEVKIIKRAEGGRGSGVRDLKRAKVNYLRDRAGLMERIAGALKADAQVGQVKGKGKRR